MVALRLQSCWLAGTLLICDVGKSENGGKKEEGEGREAHAVLSEHSMSWQLSGQAATCGRRPRPLLAASRAACKGAAALPMPTLALTLAASFSLAQSQQPTGACPPARPPLARLGLNKLLHICSHSAHSH